MAEGYEPQPLARPINPNNVSYTIESSIANSIEVLSRATFVVTGYTYLLNLYLNTTALINAGESKWFVFNPAPRSNIAGIVFSPNDTTQYGVFSLMSNGNLWVRITTDVPSGRQLVLSASGLAD